MVITDDDINTFGFRVIDFLDSLYPAVGYDHQGDAVFGGIVDGSTGNTTSFRVSVRNVIFRLFAFVLEIFVQ